MAIRVKHEGNVTSRAVAGAIGGQARRNAEDSKALAQMAAQQNMAANRQLNGAHASPVAPGHAAAQPGHASAPMVSPPPPPTDPERMAAVQQRVGDVKNSQLAEILGLKHSFERDSAEQQALLNQEGKACGQSSRLADAFPDCARRTYAAERAYTARWNRQGHDHACRPEFRSAKADCHRPYLGEQARFLARARGKADGGTARRRTRPARQPCGRDRAAERRTGAERPGRHHEHLRKRRLGVRHEGRRRQRHAVVVAPSRR